MEFADLAAIADRPMKNLSKGMGQRLCLGRTLIHNPEVLVLDEPAAGLDPKARIEFKNLIRLLSEQGKTIFISSHILSELGEMCDQLHRAGRIVHHGTTKPQAAPRAQSVVEIRVVGNPEALYA
jgi:ABC-2 type transport system ATP-binding protein